MVEVGEKVLVDFVGTLDDGSEFSNSYLVGEPFEFVVGSHVMLPAFEKAVCDMEVGEEIEIRIPPAEAYGEYDETLVERAPVKMIPNARELPLGKYIVFNTPQGELRVKVLGIEGDTVLFDHNHELAGKALNFKVKLVDVVQETAIERELHPAGCGCGCDRLKESLGKE